MPHSIPNNSGPVEQNRQRVHEGLARKLKLKAERAAARLSPLPTNSDESGQDSIRADAKALLADPTWQSAAYHDAGGCWALLRVLAETARSVFVQARREAEFDTEDGAMDLGERLLEVSRILDAALGGRRVHGDANQPSGGQKSLLLAARCALADLEGLAFDVVDLDSDEPVAQTIRELRVAIADAESKEVAP